MKHALITLKSALAGLLATLIIGFFVGAIGEAAAAETTAALFTPAPGDTAATARLAEKRASGKPHVARQRAVGINFPSLEPREGRRSVALTVELFDGVALLADLDRIEIRGAQSYSWFGRIRGLPNSRATLTVVKGVLAGNLIVLDDWHRVKGSYQIESAGDGLYLLEEIDPSAFPEDHPPGIDLQPPIPPMRLDGPTPRVNEKSGATVTVDVMVVYSSQTASAAGSAIDAQIQAAVDSANSIYANSGVDTRLRLVYSGPASYSQSGDFYTDLDRLTGTGDGAMDNVHALRDAYGADMVSLWIETGTYCGLGWIGPSASYAFTVVNRGCATSNSTFAHELGHNMGALHDPYVDSSTYPYSYGHGHVNLVARWRTVMSYNDQCAATAPGTSCTRIPYFSNPNLTYGGAPLGTAAAGSTPTADNARVHNQVAATVAAFRPTAAGPQCTYALSPTAASPASTGGSATVSVTTQAGCAWTATSSASWLTISGATSGTGNGTVSYATSANTGAARTATLSIGGSTVTVTQAALICSYSLSPGSSSVAAAASAGTVAVSAPTGCAWTAASSASWLTVTAGASGSGNGTVTYAAATNTGTTRTANLTVGGQTFTVTQATGCTYAVSPSSISTAATAGSGAVAVTSGTGCGWTAASSASWLTVTSGASGSGNGTVAYSTGANAGGVRTATLTIGGNAVTVTQAAQSCSYTLSPASGSFTAAGGTGTATMNVSAGCAWTAASNASWLTVTAGATGSGNGSVSYSASVNTGPARAANLTIGGKVFPVTQATGCTYSVSPTSISATAAASNGIVAVTSGSGCSWTATSGAGWLTVGSGASGTGNGTVGYTVSANDGTARTATLIVGGNAVTVTQDAPTTPPATDVPWIEDAVPQGASLIADVDNWQWASSNPAPFSGALAHPSALAAGIHQHYFYNATPTTTMAVGAGDTLFAYVYLDPANPPDTVMLQWNDGTWEHRAYWGANLTPWGTDGTPSRRPMGALPAAGRWVRLEVPAAQVGLEGRTVNGMAFTLHGGRATWDYAGKRTSAPSPIHQMSGVVTQRCGAERGRDDGRGWRRLHADECGRRVQLHRAGGLDRNGDAGIARLWLHAGVAQLHQRHRQPRGAGLWRDCHRHHYHHGPLDRRCGPAGRVADCRRRQLAVDQQQPGPVLGSAGAPVGLGGGHPPTLFLQRDADHHHGRRGGRHAVRLRLPGSGQSAGHGHAAMERRHLGAPGVLGCERDPLGHRRDLEPKAHGCVAGSGAVGAPGGAGGPGRTRRTHRQRHGVHPPRRPRHLGLRREADQRAVADPPDERRRDTQRCGAERGRDDGRGWRRLHADECGRRVQLHRAGGLDRNGDAGIARLWLHAGVAQLHQRHRQPRGAGLWRDCHRHHYHHGPLDRRCGPAGRVADCRRRQLAVDQQQPGPVLGSAGAPVGLGGGHPPTLFLQRDADHHHGRRGGRHAVRLRLPGSGQSAGHGHAAMERRHLGAPGVLGCERDPLGHRRDPEPEAHGCVAGSGAVGAPGGAGGPGRTRRTHRQRHGVHPPRRPRHLGLRREGSALRSLDCRGRARKEAGLPATGGAPVRTCARGRDPRCAAAAKQRIAAERSLRWTEHPKIPRAHTPGPGA
ncbi:MAG: hypothetical protein IPH55_03335 [Betaproteobacteria bacterium]|nr:hypothetical protein [Betaproteobacteria bacterium]